MALSQNETVSSGSGETQSQQVQSEPNESKAAEPSDQWAEAQEAFEDPDTFAGDESNQDLVKTENEQESEPKSHLEQGEPKQQQADALDLEKLAVPNKYKGKVQEFVKPLIEQHQREATAVKEQLGQFQQANQSLVDVFKEIANDPKKLVEYIDQYGEQVGLPSDVVGRYRSLRQNQANRQTTQPLQGQSSGPISAQQIIQGISQKYADRLASEPDGREFVRILDERDAEIMSAMQAQYQTALDSYHQRTVNPLLDRYQSQEREAQQKAVVSAWNSARDNLAKKYSDFSKYENQVRDKLLNHPLRAALNANPQVMAQAGYTHETLMDEVYQIVSRADHLAQARQPAPREWEGGLPPRKHINTMRAGGNDFDEIFNDLWKDS